MTNLKTDYFKEFAAAFSVMLRAAMGSLLFVFTILIAGRVLRLGMMLDEAAILPQASAFASWLAYSFKILFIILIPVFLAIWFFIIKHIFGNIAGWAKATKITVSAIFVFALVLRIGAYFILKRHVNPLFWEYDRIADNFLAGNGLCIDFLGITHYAYLEPFYPLLSALFYKLTNCNYMVFGLVNIFFSGILTLAIFSLARNLFSEEAGILAAFITAVHPGLIYYSTEFHPLTFDVLFFTMIVASLVRLSKTAAARDALLAGFFIGIAYLSRTTALIFIPVALLLVALLKIPIKRKLKLSVCVLLLSLSAVAAWSARNYVVLHKVVITRSSPGWLLWLGNNPNHTGSSLYTKDKGMVATLSDEDNKKLMLMDELGQNRFFTERAVTFIKGDPAAFFTRWATRICYFWWFSPQAGYLYPGSWLLIYKSFYLLLLVPAVLAVSMIAVRGRKQAGVYLPGVILTVCCCLLLGVAQTAFYVDGRHRWVIEPILGIFSAWFYIRVFGRMNVKGDIKL